MLCYARAGQQKEYRALSNSRLEAGLNVNDPISQTQRIPTCYICLVRAVCRRCLCLIDSELRRCQTSIPTGTSRAPLGGKQDRREHAAVLSTRGTTPTCWHASMEKREACNAVRSRMILNSRGFICSVSSSNHQQFIVGDGTRCRHGLMDERSRTRYEVKCRWRAVGAHQQQTSSTITDCAVLWSQWTTAPLTKGG